VTIDAVAVHLRPGYRALISTRAKMAPDLIKEESMKPDITEKPKTAEFAASAPGSAPARLPKARPTKKQLLIQLLSGKTGMDVTALSRKLGWQAHTTRAALTGLRKAGYMIAIERKAEGKPGKYRITECPTGQNQP